MPTSHALTGNLADLIGADLPARATWVTIITNLAAGDAVIDATGKMVRVPTHRFTLPKDGTFSVDLWSTAAATNPTGYQYQALVEYTDARNGGRKTWSSGWFSHTSTQDLANIVVEQLVPPTYLSQVIAQLDGKVAEAEAAAQSAKGVDGIGTVTALAPGAEPTASFSGASPSRVINLGIPGAVADDASMAAQVDAGGEFASRLSASTAAAIEARMTGGAHAHSGFAWYAGGATLPDTYQAVNAFGADTGLLAGNTGYTRQREGTPAHHAPQSRMRRCILHNDGSRVVYYLDCDDSSKIAGGWDGATQTGWVRVYEGPRDPVRPTPGQTTSPDLTLRRGVPAWSATIDYRLGDRVTYGGSLWDCLSNATGITPAAGTSAADLTGTAGQVMVEVPAFYYRMDYDPTRRRHTYEVAFDPTGYKPFPDLTVAASLPDMLGDLALHPAFVRAGVKRTARYHSAFRASATDPGDNAIGTLKSVAGAIPAHTISQINFRNKVRNNNIGLTDPSGHPNNTWSLCDYWTRHALNLLLVTEYRTHYSQAVVGGGNIAGGDYTPTNGRSVPIGNGSGVFDASGVAQSPSASGDFSGMTWRGIEDLWGSSWQWCDGWNIRNGPAFTEHWMSSDPAAFTHDTTSGYTLAVASKKGADSWQYPTNLEPTSFLAREAGASVTTYLTDGYYANAETLGGWRAPRVGANAGIGGLAGVSAFLGYGGAGGANVDLGAGLTR